MNKLLKSVIAWQRGQGMLRALLLLCLLPTSSVVFAAGYGVNSNNSNQIDVLLKGASQSNQKQNTVSTTASSTTTSTTATSSDSPAPDNALGSDPVGKVAFSVMSRNMMPLTPEQIKTLHILFDKTQRATADYPGTPPKPTSTTLTVNLSPGATPPLIRLRQGYVTSLVFVDGTGAPWPIQAYDLGDQKSFNVQWNQKSNTMMIQALTRYTSGNLAVVLKGLNTPIMITLMPGQPAVDYRVDLRIPKIGPNAVHLLDGLPSVENPSLISVLDGVPPRGSESLTIEGGDSNAQAWLVDGHIFLRTTMSLLSPAFISTMSSPDGTHAYELQATPVVLALFRGKTVSLTIKGL